MTPAVNVPDPLSAPAFLSNEQCQALLQQAEGDQDLHDIISIILYTGVRPGELEVTTWGDIDFDHDQITINNPKCGTRHIPIDSKTKSVLQTRLSGQQPTAEFVLGERPKTVLRRVQRGLKRLALKLGIPQAARLYTLRSTWAWRLVVAGIEPIILLKLGGWSYLTLEKRYRYCRITSDSIANSYRAAIEMIKAQETPEPTSAPADPILTSTTDMETGQE